MTLADTSAWVEFLRATGSHAHERLREAGAAGQLAVTDPVIMEVLAGARDEVDRRRLRRTLDTAHYLAVAARRDYERAADLYRACRHEGETIRSLVDCLIAAVALRNGVAVLHCDGDFDAIARHAPLTIA